VKVIYIAAPFRARNAWLVEQNIRIAELAAFEVAKRTLQVVLCPHTMYRYFDGTMTDEYWLAATAELLKRCDAVLMAGDWKQSEGAQAERDQALAEDLPIFDDVEQVVRWVS